MKIAINCMFCAPQSGGVKEYIVNLTNSLASIDYGNEYVLYVLEDQYDYAIKNLPNRFKIKKIPYQSNFLSKIKRSLFSQAYWYKEELKEGFDLFHSPFFYAPKFKKSRLVITVHDLRLYRFPKTYGLLRYFFLRRTVKKTIMRADIIISVSQFTKDEIINCCDIPEDKITVIHEAIDRETFSTKILEGYSLPLGYEKLKNSRFLFSLSHIEPRKNHIRLIEAFRMMKSSTKYGDVKLVIAGRINWKSKKIKEAINNTDDVIYLNFVTKDLLLWLYKHTTLFVFPSYYEGFGFPPLEAASMGTVSAVSRVSSIPEVCGDCAFYFDPFSTESISNVLSSCLDNPQIVEEKKQMLDSQLNKFSWINNAEVTLSLYRSLVE